MFEKWKEILRNIFTKEVEYEMEEEMEAPSSYPNTYYRKNSEPEVKVTYQYPSKKEFPFPVIPDQEQRESRRTRRETLSPTIQPEKQQPVRNRDRRKEKTEAVPATRKIYKKDPDLPFKLTEVPSPIYGYQHQQKKTVEEVPAFTRKKEKELQSTGREETQHSVQENRVEKQTEQSTVQEPAGTETAERESFPSKIENQETATRVSEAEQTPVMEDKLEERRAKREERKKGNPLDSKQSKLASDTNETGKKARPFNVIMTPRDKKNLFDKKKAAQQELSAANDEAVKRNEDAKTTTVTLEVPVQKTEQTVENVKPTEVNPAEETVIPVQTDQPVAEEHKAIPYHLLNDPVEQDSSDHAWVEEQKELLEQTLKHFNVRAKVVKATKGPSVTRFEVQPEMGVKVSKIRNLSDDLKLNMAAKDIRIEAPIPGKHTVGIEVPNLHSEMVGLQEIMETDAFQDSQSLLSIALGLTIEGNPKVTNIQKMPHGLIAGATGSGKSVCINTILLSLIYKASHEDVKFLLIDPKMVELAPYNGIPHLVSPVITDVKAATQSLKWAVNEMEERYGKFVTESVRDIERYNAKMKKQGRLHDKMPYIIIVIDELADLMMMSPQDVEDSISRIAQKARACGIHLLLATQRPSVDVITGLIKANIPTRIAFSVSSQVDSRTILDASGAEKLLGKGDMLFVENGEGKSVRLQGPFVSDDEIERVTNYARGIAEPNYLFEQEELLEQIQEDEEEDELMDEAISFVVNHDGASTSLMQRHFKIGYNRAARIIDALEARGIIAGQNGSKPREVLVTRAQLDEQ